MQKILWSDGTIFEVAGNTCLSIKSDAQLLFPSESNKGGVWIEALDLTTIIKHAEMIKRKDATIPVVCNSIWFDEDRIELFLKHRELFSKVVLMPYVRGKALSSTVYWECFHELKKRLYLVPKDQMIIDLVMPTTISPETKTINDFKEIIKTLHAEGYQTVISLENYEFHSKDAQKEENLRLLSELLRENKVAYLLTVKRKTIE